MLEVEQKYRIDDGETLAEKLLGQGAAERELESHADTYYRHPSRNFVETNEALRIRSVNASAAITYKGPKVAVSDATLKARKEIEFSLAPGDTDGSKMADLLVALGFSRVATVRKQRRSFGWPSEHKLAAFTVTIDLVADVGVFCEIELLINEYDSESIEAAGSRIRKLADVLGVDSEDRIRESYLEMFLATKGEA